MASWLKLARLANQAASAQKALQRPPTPPAGRFERTLALAVHRGIAVALLISASFALGVLALSSDAAWLAWLRIVLGLILLAEGLLLATDLRGARRLTIWRMRRGDASQQPLSLRLMRKLAGPGLQLLGIAWLGAGVLAITVALPSLV